MTCKQLLLSCYSCFLGLGLATKCEIRLGVLKEKTHRKKKTNSKKLITYFNWGGDGVVSEWI